MRDLGRQLQARLRYYYAHLKHGDLPGWRRALRELPVLTPSVVRLDAESVQVGKAADASDDSRESLRHVLSSLKPWRKGPFSLFGLELDAEWRSDLKWARLRDKITPLEGRRVLDVGCGNGYFGWRMLGAGAELVIGLDPVLRYLMQFRVLKTYLPRQPLELLPFRLDDLVDESLRFDTVFSMGVLYHHPDPQTHLQQLRNSLRPGGELVLESLIVDEHHGDGLRPNGPYARMKNIYIIPNIRQLTTWLKTAGYRAIELLDVTPTDSREQRVTAWSGDRSLADFLATDGSGLTEEGHPPPVRALFTACK